MELVADQHQVDSSQYVGFRSSAPGRELESPKRSHVGFVVAPDTVPESAILSASQHARQVAMETS